MPARADHLQPTRAGRTLEIRPNYRRCDPVLKYEIAADCRPVRLQLALPYRIAAVIARTRSNPTAGASRAEKGRCASFATFLRQPVVISQLKIQEIRHIAFNQKLSALNKERISQNRG